MAAPEITAVRSAAYRFPTDRPEADGTLAWDATTLVTAQVDAAGRTGLGWTYGPAAVAGYVEELGAVLPGRPAAEVPAAWAALVRQLRNATRPGLAGYALSALDVALWDL